MWWLAFVACASRRADRRVERLISAVDRAWEGRAERGLPAVDVALERAEAAAPDAVALAWRRARERLAVASVDTGGERLRRLAEARDVATRCVQVGLDVETGWVSPERRVCLPWAALAWTRWWVAIDPEAAALDRPRIDALLALSGPIDDAGPLRDARLLRRLGDPEQALDAAVALTQPPTGWRLEVVRDWAERHGQAELAARLTGSMAQLDAIWPEDRAPVDRARAGR